MSITSRLNKLERETGIADGRCPGCHFYPDSIRTIVMGRHPVYRPGEPVRPFVEFCADPEIDDQPGRPRCAVCGGYMPPIAFVNEP